MGGEAARNIAKHVPLAAKPSKNMFLRTQKGGNRFGTKFFFRILGRGGVINDFLGPGVGVGNSYPGSAPLKKFPIMYGAIYAENTTSK